MNCPNCKKEVPENAKVCGYCGTKLEIKRIRTCPECGKEIPAKAKVCGLCGSKLTKPALKTQTVTSIPTKGSPPSEQAASSVKGKPKWGLIGAIAAILIITAVLLWFFTMRSTPTIPQPSSVKEDTLVSVPFADAVGNWEAIDSEDGSLMHIKISQTQNTMFNITLIDEGASICGYDSTGNNLLSFKSQGSGIPKGNTITVNENGLCDGSDEEIVFASIYTYNQVGDTLMDEYGTIWYRK
jgi:hypothetical protein